MARRVLAVAVGWGGVLGALSSLACSPPQSSEPHAPWNVVLISVDTLRADHVSSYRGEEGTLTPNIDRLAREGVLFETVQSVAPTTLPSHASLFTGRTPPGHGVRDNVGYYLSPDVPTVAARMKAAGYRTGGFVGSFVLDSRFGVAQGFDTYFDDFESEEEGIAGGLVAHRRGGQVLDRALAWLSDTGEAEAGDPPFFAFVHFYDPHAPYDAPSGGDGAPADRYRDEVVYVDTLVGELLDWLDESGLASRTLVVLTSDHGEALGDHGEDTHGFFVYQSTLAVPLILRFPGGPEGARVAEVSSLVDVAPTVLDLLDLPELEGAEGASLSLLVHGGTSGSRAAYSETFVPRVHFGWSELRSVRLGDYKFVLAPRPELYHLSVDPGERVNLASEEPDRARSMAAELEKHRKVEAASELELDDEGLARLRGPGYTGGSAASSSSSTLADPKDRIELYTLLIDTELSDVAPSDGQRFDEALARLEGAIEVDPSVPRSYVLYGELLLKSGRVARAVDVFERLVTLDDESFEGHYGLGVTLARAGRFEAAIVQLERARALQPENTKSYFQLAELEAHRENWASAERWLRQAMDRNPDRVLTERLAQVLLRSGKRSEARELLVGLVESDANDPLAAYNLGQLLLLDGEAEGALDQFRRASEISPDADAFQGIGNALVALGRLDEARVAYQRAVTMTPCFAPALSNLGSTYVQLERFEEAREPLERALDCDPSYVRAYQNLATTYLGTDDLEGALTVIRSGLRANPQSLELAGTLEELERYLRSRPRR